MLTPFVFVMSSLFVLLNTSLWSALIIVVALFKLCVPWQPWRRVTTQIANRLMWCWCACQAFYFRLINGGQWRLQGGEQLTPQQSYLMIANHRSWSDIVVICSLFYRRMPMTKFFMKQQLLYIPFMGLACWALDMPFMRRYSRETLIRKPHLRGRDLQTTRKSCAKFKGVPTTVVNFVEGTRATPDKLKRSSYRHLLAPKSAGIAYTLAAMGEQFSAIVDVTLLYPRGQSKLFLAMLAGRLNRVTVVAKTLPVDAQVIGDYFNDKPFKRDFQLWLSDRWQQKDQQMDDFYHSESKSD
ncbi:acyltransferase [Vibrio stylophorae]|uniref:acyltransferase n=1 Tax=Vibrio stylophorae TaxID=659351 RepID=UPI003F4A4AD0